MESQALQTPINFLDQSGGVMSAVSDDLMPDNACRLSLNFRLHGKRGAARKREGYKRTILSGTYSMNPDGGMVNKLCKGLGSFSDWQGTQHVVFGAWNGQTFANEGPFGFSATNIGSHADASAMVRYDNFINRVFRVGGGDDTRSWDGKLTGTFDATQCAKAPRAELVKRFKSRLILGRLTGRAAAASTVASQPTPTVSARLAAPANVTDPSILLDSMPFPGTAVPYHVWVGTDDATYQPTVNPTVGGVGVIYTDVGGGSTHFKIHGGDFTGILVGATIEGSNPANPDVTISVTVSSFVSATEMVVSASKDIPYGIAGWTYRNAGSNDGRIGNNLVGLLGLTQFWPTGTLVRTYQSTLVLANTSAFADSGSFHIGSQVVTYTGNDRVNNILTGCSGFDLAYIVGTPVTQDATPARPSSIFRSSIPDVDGNISWDPDVLVSDAGEIPVNPDDGDDLRAMIEVGGMLLLMKLNYTYRWNGTSLDPEPIISVGAETQECVGVVREVAYWFHRSGFYAGNGGTPTCISSLAIQDWVDAIPAANRSSVRFYTDGQNPHWFIGTIVKDGRTFTNCALEYDVDLNAWLVHVLHDPIAAFTMCRLKASGQSVVQDLPVIEGTLGQGWFAFQGFADDDTNEIQFERRSRGMWFDSPATTKEIEEVTWFLDGSARAVFSAAPDQGKLVPFARKQKAKDQGIQQTATGKVIEFIISGSSTTSAEWRGFVITKAKTLGIT